MNAWVLGMGRSGLAAARLLRKAGYQVTLLDERAGAAGAEDMQQLVDDGVTILSNSVDLPKGKADLMVVSPGLSENHPWVLEGRVLCGEVLSELELGYRYCKVPILAVTGTNGKSTLTRLVHEILVAAGCKSAAGGNLGVPLCEMLLQHPDADWFVVEVSSFQLELVATFHPRGAVLLNVQPDHLDRHGSMETYFEIKCRIFGQMQAGDCAVVQDALLAEVIAQREQGGDGAGPDWISFGAGSGGWRYDGTLRSVCGEVAGQQVMLPVGGTYFDNEITGATAAAGAALVTRVCGVEPAVITEILAAFRPLAHRTESVAEIDGVGYVDDSKATNLAAMCAALSMQKRPVRLIAGGLLKEKDVEWTKQVLKKHVVCVYLIGSSASLLGDSWCDTVAVEACGTLENAMKSVFRDVQPGEVVLLSPGCASFDQFRSYAERGKMFARLVLERC